MSHRLVQAVVIGALGLSACTLNLTTPDEDAVTSPDLHVNEIAQKTILHTPLGEFEIVTSRMVDEVHDFRAGAEEKILLVVLAEPGEKIG